jgi:hypothetical protein
MTVRSAMVLGKESACVMNQNETTDIWKISTDATNEEIARWVVSTTTPTNTSVPDSGRSTNLDHTKTDEDRAKIKSNLKSLKKKHDLTANVPNISEEEMRKAAPAIEYKLPQFAASHIKDGHIAKPVMAKDLLKDIKPLRVQPHKSKIQLPDEQEVEKSTENFFGCHRRLLMEEHPIFKPWT